MMAHYDAKNPEALVRLVASGTTVSIFPTEVLEGIYAASQEHYAALIASNERLRRSTSHRRNSGIRIISTTSTPIFNTTR
jgi:TRAP-type mannitol/chloroaromatic compound transport system substrate-binding protein